MRGRSLPAVGLVALLAAAPAARAEVVVGEGVPFTAAELEDALAARAGAADADADVSVAIVSADGTSVRLVTANGSWHVAVGDAHGADAARLVALHLVEASGLGAIALPPPRVAAAPSRTPRVEALADAPEVVDDLTGDRPARSSRWLALRAGGTRGTARTDLPGLAVGVEVGGERASWIAAAEVGALVSGTSSDAGDVRWLMPHARLSGGRRVGGVDLLGGVLVGRALLANVSARDAANMVALGGSARASWPIGRGRWRLVAGLGADAYHHRIVIRRLGVEEASTPRVALTASLAVTLGSDR